MKVTVFTSNQRRHLSLIRSLAECAEQVYAIQEVTTLFPGAVDDFYKKSVIMKRYFENVLTAESNIFGSPSFLPKNVRSLALKMGDLNEAPSEWFGEALKSDVFIIFGASFIKPPLVDLLVERRAINIHMGISPHYRGNSCNFWAMYDGKSEYVGATIHLLTRGLDSGPILCHVFPEFNGETPFEFTMKAVRSAHLGVASRIKDGSLSKLSATSQDRKLQIRYSKREDFTDEIAMEFLNRVPTLEELQSQVNRRDLKTFLNPIIC